MYSSDSFSLRREEDTFSRFHFLPPSLLLRNTNNIQTAAAALDPRVA